MIITTIIRKRKKIALREDERKILAVNKNKKAWYEIDFIFLSGFLSLPTIRIIPKILTSEKKLLSNFREVPSGYLFSFIRKRKSVPYK